MPKEGKRFVPLGYVYTPTAAKMRMSSPNEPELRIPRPCSSNASGLHGRNSARIGESARAFKGIICDDVSEFESDMPSHAVGSLQCQLAAVYEELASTLVGYMYLPAAE